MEGQNEDKFELFQTGGGISTTKTDTLSDKIIGELSDQCEPLPKSSYDSSTSTKTSRMNPDDDIYVKNSNLSPSPVVNLSSRRTKRNLRDIYKSVF